MLQGNIDFVGAARTPNFTARHSSRPEPARRSARSSPRPSSRAEMLTITGTLDSVISTPFALDFYSSKPTTPVLAFGQAQTYLGSSSVMSDSQSHAAFTVTLSDPNYASGDLFTATATDSLGDTSEISDDYPNVEPPALADLSVTGVGRAESGERLRLGDDYLRRDQPRSDRRSRRLPEPLRPARGNRDRPGRRSGTCRDHVRPRPGNS